MSQARVAALLPRLWCHQWAPASLPAAAVEPLQSAGVFLDTCLRQLAFGLAPTPALPEIGGESWSGASAYRLLLEVATGLRSAVPGETNVGGQFRRASELAATLMDPGRWHELKPIVGALLADARAVRRNHLQDPAGLSYGSLVRTLLAPRRDARILFVGTGELTRSMLPRFAGDVVGVWNRRPSMPLGGIHRWFAPREADEAAAWATNVVLTLPVGAASDLPWLERLRHHPQRSVVHLGSRRTNSLRDHDGSHYALDDVFALASTRDRHRQRQLAAAATACGELLARRADRLVAIRA